MTSSPALPLEGRGLNDLSPALPLERKWLNDLSPALPLEGRGRLIVD